MPEPNYQNHYDALISDAIAERVLEKIAELSQNDRDTIKERAPGVLGAGLVVGGGTLSSPALHTKLVEPIFPARWDVAKHESVPLLRKLERAAKLKPIQVGVAQGAPPTHAWYKPFGNIFSTTPEFRKEHFVLPKRTSAAVVAHEVGHATAPKALLAITGGVRALGYKGIIPGALLLHAALTGKKDEDLPWSTYTSPIVAGVSSFAELPEELRANIKARQLLRSTGLGNMRVKDIARQLGHRAGGALLKTLPFVGGATLLSAIHTAQRNKNSLQKWQESLPGFQVT